MSINSYIRGDEELYRSVRIDPKYDECCHTDTGELVIQPAAFRDTCKKPSVDRAELNGCDPSLSKLSCTDGIVSLITSDVRAIPDKDGTIADHIIDVIYAPTMERSAHSQITMTPKSPVTNSRRDKVFKKLRYALAHQATEKGWTLAPSEIQSEKV